MSLSIVFTPTTVPVEYVKQGSVRLIGGVPTGMNGGWDATTLPKTINLYKDFEWHIRVKPVFILGRSTIIEFVNFSDLNRISVDFGINGSGSVIFALKTQTPAITSTYTFSNPQSSFTQKWTTIGIARINGVFNMLVDGVIVTPDNVPAVNNSPQKVAVICGSAIYTDQFSGDLDFLPLFNRGLTSQERLDIVEGIIPQDLAYPAKNLWLSTQPLLDAVGWAVAPTSKSYTAGGNFNLNGGPFSGVYMNELTGQIGSTLRIKGNITSITPGVPLTFTTLDGVSPRQGFAPVSGTGEFDIYLVTTTPFDGLGVRFETAALGNYVTMSNLSLEVIGIKARYEPEDILATGRWLDSSGNGFDLNGPHPGVIPLNQQSIQTRTDYLVYSPPTSAYGNKPYGWVLDHYGPGVIGITVPAYVAAGMPTGSISTGNATTSAFETSVYYNGTNIFTCVIRNPITHAPVDADQFSFTAHWKE